jgi:hypothetical protein
MMTEQQQRHELDEALAKVREAQLLLDLAYDAYCDSPRSEEIEREFDGVADRQWCILSSLNDAIYEVVRTLEGRYGIAVTIAGKVDQEKALP